MLYCMNNHNREHARIFGVPDAFYDLNAWGRQAAEAKKLSVGMTLLVVTQPARDQLRFEEWHYTRDESRLVDDKPVQLLCGSRTGQSETLSREAAYARHPAIFRRSIGRPALKLGWSILGPSSAKPGDAPAQGDGAEAVREASPAEWLDWMRRAESLDDWRLAAEGLADLFATEDDAPQKQRAYREEDAYWVEIRRPLPGVRLLAFQLSLLDLPPKVSLKIWIDDDAPEVYRSFAGRRFTHRGQLAASWEDQSPNGSWAQQMKQSGAAVRGILHDIALAPMGDARQAGAVLSALFVAFCEFVNACFEGSPAEWATQGREDAAPPSAPAWQPDAQRMEQLLAAVTSFSDTERDSLVKARIGQTIFRRQLLERWGMKCSVTGLANPDVLIASHIVPWSRCAQPHERWDVENGLLLTPGLDRAFELGLIAFDGRGRIIVSSKASVDTQLKLGIDRNQRIRTWYEGLGKYLERHRALHRLEA